MHNFPLIFFAQDCTSGSFFGLRPWYYYLPNSGAENRFDANCDIKNFVLLPSGQNGSSDVPLVLLAIIDDLLRIAALVAVGFVIVGAVQMITSQGSPDEASKARSTIINALLGLAIAIIAAAFVSFLGNALG